ncbi:13996_t:CDS:1, partial [Funneliformis geosporum]
CITKAAEKFIPIHHFSQYARDLRPKTLKKVYQSKKALHSGNISQTWVSLY